MSKRRWGILTWTCVSGGRARVRTAAVVVTVIALIVSGCTGTRSDDERSGEPATAGVDIRDGQDAVTVVAELTVTAHGANVPAGGRLRAEEIPAPDAVIWTGADLTSTVQIEIGSDAAIAGSALTVEAPVAESGTDTVTGLVILDEEGYWRALGARLSEDGSTVAASLDVNTLAGGRGSGWAPFKNVWKGVVGVVTTASDAAAGGLHWLRRVADQRADGPPTCQGKVPQWVTSTVYTADHRDNPIRWCAGSDPKDSSVLVVKLVVNRPFSALVKVNAQPAWRWASAYEGTPLDQLVGALDEPFRDLGDFSLEKGSMLIPGLTEYHLGFRQSDLASWDPSTPLVESLNSGWAPWIVALAEELTGLLLDGDSDFAHREAQVLVAVIAAQCIAGVVQVSDAGDVQSAFVGCADKVGDIRKVIERMDWTSAGDETLYRVTGKFKKLGSAVSHLKWVDLGSKAGDLVYDLAAFRDLDRQFSIGMVSPGGTGSRGIDVRYDSHGSERAGFVTADGNVACEYDSDGSSSVMCVINEFTYEVQPQQEDGPPCGNSAWLEHEAGVPYGQAAFGLVGPGCVGDVLVDPDAAPTLDRGDVARYGEIACTVLANGVRCEHDPDTWFELTRDAMTLHGAE